MARHLKSIVKNRLKGIITRYIPNAEVSASHRRGVCYLEFIPAIEMYYGAMSTHKEGRRYNKPSPRSSLSNVVHFLRMVFASPLGTKLPISTSFTSDDPSFAFLCPLHRH